MNRQRAQRLIWWALVLVTVASFTGALLLKRTFTTPELVVISFLVYALVGAVVSWQRPGNPIGWVFMVIGLLTGLAGISGAVTEMSLENGPPVDWWGVLTAWFDSWFWYPLIVLATTVTFLLYPNGLASARWRPVLWLTVAATTLGTTVTALAPVIAVGNTNRDSPDYDPRSFSIENPISLSFSLPFAVWFTVPMLLVAACGLAAIVSSVLRARRARGVERQQMRLFAFAVLLIPVYMVIYQLLGLSDSPMTDLAFAMVLAMVPTACGVAIMRYHLYDIDRVIGRTTAYAMVTAVLLAAYAVVVTSLTQVVPDSGSTGAPASWAVAVATLAAAALFRPVLRWARRVVARRFDREQFDAELIVERFAVRLRDEVAPQAVGEDLLQVLGRTMQPRVSGVWLSDRHVS